ncbi:MAG: hypothetical protein J5642_07995 [Bacteroidales bacterium]|nr:hypothetical protein [Bacteroidales bacterium]
MSAIVRQPLNSAQIEMLSALAQLNSEEDLRALKDALSKFFAERADREMEKLWDEGVINEQVIEKWSKEHMRTPYH